MEIRFTKDAVKQINALDKPAKNRIMDAAITSGDLYDESDIDWN